MWEEDFERAAYLHYMYRIEKQMEEEETWWQWEMEQQQQPATITITKLNSKEDEVEHNTLPFRRAD